MNRDFIESSLRECLAFDRLSMESLWDLKTFVEGLDYQDSLLYITILSELGCLPKYNKQILKPLQLSYDKDKKVFMNLLKRKKLLKRNHVVLYNEKYN